MQETLDTNLISVSFWGVEMAQHDLLDDIGQLLDFLRFPCPFDEVNLDKRHFEEFQCTESTITEDERYWRTISGIASTPNNTSS